MPQFAVYKNRNEVTRGRFPLLLDVQSDLLEPLKTRVVVPLSLVATARSRAIR
jgi:toxin CcdB